MRVYPLKRGAIVQARVEDVYPTMADGSVSLVHSDGPYNLGKAAWDRVPSLADFYRPHIAEWSRVCAASASVYLWNTHGGIIEVDPEMRAAGWTRRAIVTWDKGIGFLAGKIDTEGTRTWPDVTEVCAFYQREALAPLGGPAQMVAFAAGASERNSIRVWLNEERERAGIGLAALKQLIGVAGGAGEMLVRHTFYESQWLLPTFDQWLTLHTVWNTSGNSAGRPYLQRGETGRVWDRGVRADYEALRADYEALRADYEALRAPFTLPTGITNVWTHPTVAGAERLTDGTGVTLHPCQKPLLFARRIVEASSRPGDLILEPFAGTCRIAVAVESAARYAPEEARRYLCVEMDTDGRDYIPAVLRQLGALPESPGTQTPLFGGAACGS